MTPKDLYLRLEADELSTILAACPRRLREGFFQALELKRSRPAMSFRRPKQDEDRIGSAIQLLPAAQPSDQLLADILRHFFLLDRALLEDALNHFRIPHQGGLTEGDLSPLTSLAGDERASFVKDMAAKGHERRTVELYLDFLAIQP